MSIEDQMDQLQVQLPGELTLLRPLGRGGMGQVYTAHDVALGEVVVKVMHAHLSRGNAERLRLEAEALARLVSPHIVRLHRWGLAQGRPYLVMERLTGESLGAWLRAGPMEPITALRIARDVCLGLAVVHQHKVVHRDIKPDNVVVCEDRAVLLDFGVVKLIERVTGVLPLQNPTSAGAAVGTPRYMSPEQARGDDVDGRADIYGVGAMLFRMVTGEHVFPGDGLEEVLVSHVLEPPRHASEVASGLPSGLDDVLLRALAKRPQDRFQNANAMAEALETLVPGLVATRLEPPTAQLSTEMLELPPDSEAEVMTRARRYPVSTPARTEVWPRPESLPTSPLFFPPPQLLDVSTDARNRTAWPLIALAALLAFAIAAAVAESLMT